MENEDINLSDLHTSNIKENSNAPEKPSPNYGQNTINTLNGVAWLSLIGGIIGAIIIWWTIGSIQNPNYTYTRDMLPNPDGIIIGFEVLFFSIVTSSLLFVVCVIAENLIAIRKNTEK